MFIKPTYLYFWYFAHVNRELHLTPHITFSIQRKANYIECTVECTNRFTHSVPVFSASSMRFFVCFFLFVLFCLFCLFFVFLGFFCFLFCFVFLFLFLFCFCFVVVFIVCLLCFYCTESSLKPTTRIYIVFFSIQYLLITWHLICRQLLVLINQRFQFW